jgi:hypothetical protein
MIIINTNKLSDKQFNILQKILFKQGYDWLSGNLKGGHKHKLNKQFDDMYYIRIIDDSLFRGSKEYFDDMIDSTNEKHIDAKKYIRKYKLSC